MELAQGWGRLNLEHEGLWCPHTHLDLRVKQGPLGACALICGRQSQPVFTSGKWKQIAPAPEDESH